MTNVCEVLMQPSTFSVAKEIVVPLGTALIGAGFGAWIGAVFAFRKDRRFRREELDKKDNANAHRVFFILIQQYQIIRFNLEPAIFDHKNRSNEDKRPIITKTNDLKFNIDDFSFKGRRASLAFPMLMIAERAYLQALDALECYNRSHAECVEAVKQHLLGKAPQEMVNARVTIKGELFNELYAEIKKAKKRQEEAYKVFRTNIQDRWKTWELPESISSLEKSWEEVALMGEESSTKSK